MGLAMNSDCQVSMSTLFIELLIKPRKRFTIKTRTHDAFVQCLVEYVQSHYARAPGWSLYKYGTSWGCLCHVVTRPFLSWLEKFQDIPRINEILNTFLPHIPDNGKALDPIIAVYIPHYWFCITIPPVRDQIRDMWLSKTTHTVLSASPPPITVPSLKPSDYYLLYEGRAAAQDLQLHFKRCLKENIPFIGVWHYRPKQQTYAHRYDIVFSWEPFIKSHPNIFDNPKYPGIDKVILRRITQIIKDNRQRDGFEKAQIQSQLSKGQLNILKLNFTAAEQLTLDLVKLTLQLIEEMEQKLETTEALETKLGVLE